MYTFVTCLLVLILFWRNLFDFSWLLPKFPFTSGIRCVGEVQILDSVFEVCGHCLVLRKEWTQSVW